jgi:glutamyl-tRNA synthetase
MTNWMTWFCYVLMGHLFICWPLWLMITIWELTHVIRGDDHLNNAARQMMIYNAMGWPLPVYAHMPLIHGRMGKNCPNVTAQHPSRITKTWAIPLQPCAIIWPVWAGAMVTTNFSPMQQAMEWFDFRWINKSAARFDFKKLQNLSGQHIARADDDELLSELLAYRSKIW